MAIPTPADFHVAEHIDVPRVELRSSIDLLSLQADGKRKQAFQAALGSAVRDATVGVFVHDVEATLTWYISEKRRYQTHIVADLDNVMKPILDAVTGPDGVLIDDNQIQSIKASWMTPGAYGSGFELTLEPLVRDDYLTRAGLSFVEFAADRCYLIPGALGEHAPRMVSVYRAAIAAYEKQLSFGVPESDARMILPMARPFPRARLGRFPLRHESEFPDPA